MSMLRAFIAIELPVGLQKAISQVVERLQFPAGKSAVRWVTVSNIHLTLKFLGEVAPTSLGVIEESLKTETALHPDFRMEAGGLGAFPNIKRPRVIWLGVNAPTELTSLQRGIELGDRQVGICFRAASLLSTFDLGTRAG